ncbi:MAG: hypothetical protein LBR51_00705 [Bacteroidales bacterium]|jgi:hypothetical protein|nr:hypothetical protein [Bacteroidales bacterium]
MYSFIKNYFLQQYIKTTQKPRKREVHSLFTAHSIGYLWVADSKSAWEQMLNMQNKLTVSRTRLQALAYIPGKIMPEYFRPHPNIIVFQDKDINFFGKIRLPEVKHFMEEPFDLLIDFSTSYLPAFYGVASLSCAHFIAGGEDMHASAYDLLMKNEKKVPEILFEQIKLYTSKLIGSV